MKRLTVTILIVAVAAIGVFGWLKLRPQGTTITNQSPDGQQFEFSAPKKSAHFETSTPTHEQVLPAPPVAVVINFNFDLGTGSKLMIDRDGSDYGSGELVIDDSRLTLRREMDQAAPNGLYTVNYVACWPDGSCHDGKFQFAIDRSLVDSYDDQRNRAELTIKMSQLRFVPMNLLLRAGTKVTWINNDSVEHYVNTDSHPAHTQVLDFNSRAVKPGANFSYTFNKAGSYPYHCSAHAAEMTGTIVVVAN